eukprot:gene12586-10799_t
MVVGPGILYACKPLSSRLACLFLPGVMRMVSKATAEVRASLLEPAVAQGRVLDLGCGSGEYWPLCGNADLVVGVEPNRSLHPLLRRRAQEAKCPVELHACTLEDLMGPPPAGPGRGGGKGARKGLACEAGAGPAPYARGSFDAVILGNVLCEVPDPAATLRLVGEAL